jgi:hypothetical protein
MQGFDTNQHKLLCEELKHLYTGERCFAGCLSAQAGPPLGEGSRLSELAPLLTVCTFSTVFRVLSCCSRDARQERRGEPLVLLARCSSVNACSADVASRSCLS